MNQSKRPLIVGGGPVGLAAALFLTGQGQPVRVIEMREEPSQESRALAVNPRTLEILEPTGVTAQMLELGLRIQGVNFYQGDKNFATLSLAGIHPKYPFMLALSQASTERLLERALGRAGGSVERGMKLLDCRRLADQRVVAGIEETRTGERAEYHCPWLLAADGAHSTAREKLEMAFPGSSLEKPWYLADAPLRTRLPDDHGHVFFLDGGSFVFLIRVVDDALRDRAGDPLWRVISNDPQPLNRLVQAEPSGAPFWESEFRVTHRVLTSMAAGGVYFAGDAAHLHSPIGARGMNLGIEDAWVFAELVRTGQLGRYDTLRRRVDRAVVRRVELLTRTVAAQSPVSRAARELGLPMAIRTPPLRHRMLQTVSGLDHPLPELSLPTQPAG